MKTSPSTAPERAPEPGPPTGEGPAPEDLLAGGLADCLGGNDVESGLDEGTGSGIENGIENGIGRELGGEFGPSRAPTSHARLTVGVVVPVHNGRETLPGCLAAIARSARRPDAIVIADDASTDGSGALAEGVCGAGCTVFRTGEEPLGPGAARNRAVERLDTDVVVFVDSDVEVHGSAIGRLVRPLEDERGVVASFGSYDDRPACRTTPSLYANLRHHHVHQKARRDSGTFWAGCGAVRRSAFLEAGGFDETYERPSIEDIELGRRLRDKGEIRTVPEAQGKHRKAWTIGQIWRTDVLRRAVPWSRLLVREGGLPDDLNARWAERAAAVAAHAVWLSLLAALIEPLMLLAALLAGAAWMWLNAELLALLKRRGGWRGALGGGTLHWVYHLYASAVLAGVWIEYRWEGSRTRPAAAGVAVAAAGLLALGGLSALVFRLVDPAWLLGVAESLDKNAAAPRIGLADVVAIQHSAVLLGLGYLGAALAVVSIGPKPVARVIDDAPRLPRRIRAIPAAHVLCIGLATAVGAVLAALYANQTMRVDEAYTFLNYGTRPVFVGASYLNSTNNHVLHSILMRGSVLLFGEAPWSIRLPALAAAVLCIPAIYLAGRAMLGARAGLLAAALLGGSAYTVDLATNARGYPMVNLAFLLGMALLPAVARRRPAAITGVVLLSAVGAWAVPIMLYPFSILMAWVVLRHIRPGADRPRRLAEAAGMTLATGLLVLLLYAPTLVVGVEHGRAGETLAAAVEPPLTGRIERLFINLHAAWELWTYPLPLIAGLVTLLLALAGAGIALWRGGRARLLVVAMVLGPVAVFIVTGLAAPPWWSLAFLFPVYVLLIGLALSEVVAQLTIRLPRLYAHLGRGLGRGLGRDLGRDLGGRVDRGLGGRPAISPVSAGVVLAVVAAATLVSGYPHDFPNHVGYREAERAAAYMQSQGLTDGHAFAPGVVAGPLNYYLYRAGFGEDSVRTEGSAPRELPPTVVHVTSREMVGPSAFTRRLLESGLRAEDVHRFTDSSVTVYRRAERGGWAARDHWRREGDERSQ